MLRLLEILVKNSYTEDQLMHTLLDNFFQGVNDYDQIASHKAELTRAEKFVYQKQLSISNFKNDYLYLDNPERNN